MKAEVNIAVVKDFALDVWEDLKNTGLAGVAVGMAIAFVAISAIVLKPGGPPDIKTGYASATAAPTEEVALAVPSEKPLRMEDIDMSAPRDPFQTLDELDSGGSGDGGQSIEDTTTAPTSTSGGGSPTSTGGSDTSTLAVDDSDELMPLDDLETADTVDEADDTSDEPNAEVKPDEEDTTKAPPTDYSYAADVQFGVEGSLKRYKSVQRLGFVPSRSNPLLMYLGVKADHETAVFMVDSRLSQGGEGKCVPKPSLCTFIEVSDDPSRDEHRFRDADGTEYLLRFLAVVRTSAKAGSVGGPDLAALPGTPEVVDGSR